MIGKTGLWSSSAWLCILIKFKSCILIQNNWANETTLHIPSLTKFETSKYIDDPCACNHPHSHKLSTKSTQQMTLIINVLHFPSKWAVVWALSDELELLCYRFFLSLKLLGSGGIFKRWGLMRKIGDSFRRMGAWAPLSLCCLVLEESSVAWQDQELLHTAPHHGAQQGAQMQGKKPQHWGRDLCCFIHRLFLYLLQWWPAGYYKYWNLFHIKILL